MVLVRHLVLVRAESSSAPDVLRKKEREEGKGEREEGGVARERREGIGKEGE